MLTPDETALQALLHRCASADAVMALLDHVESAFATRTAATLAAEALPATAFPDGDPELALLREFGMAPSPALGEVLVLVGRLTPVLSPPLIARILRANGGASALAGNPALHTPSAVEQVLAACVTPSATLGDHLYQTAAAAAALRTLSHRGLLDGDHSGLAPLWEVLDAPERRPGLWADVASRAAELLAAVPAMGHGALCRLAAAVPVEVADHVAARGDLPAEAWSLLLRRLSPASPTVVRHAYEALTTHDGHLGFLAALWLASHAMPETPDADRRRCHAALERLPLGTVWPLLAACDAAAALTWAETASDRIRLALHPSDLVMLLDHPEEAIRMRALLLTGRIGG